MKYSREFFSQCESIYIDNVKLIIDLLLILSLKPNIRTSIKFYWLWKLGHLNIFKIIINRVIFYSGSKHKCNALCTPCGLINLISKVISNSIFSNCHSCVLSVFQNASNVEVHVIPFQAVNRQLITTTT